MDEMNMKDEIKVVIDGKDCVCRKGEYIYDVAKRNGVFIPTLCRHDGMEPRAACRLCIVEVQEGSRTKTVTSCAYPIERECEVRTNTPEIRKHRATILMLLQARAPEARSVKAYGSNYAAQVPEALIKLNGEACILCGLCVQACDMLGTGAISTVLRGTEKCVSTPYGDPSADCVGCASCADVCPTDAIEVVDTATGRRIWGRDFALVACAKCGELVGTAEELARAHEKEDGPAKDAQVAGEVLCERCKRRITADGMARSFGR